MGDAQQPVSAAARRYARAFFEAARDQGVLEEVSRDVELIRHAAGHPEVSGWLADPRVDPGRKQELLERELSSRVHPLTMGLLQVVGRRRRHEILPQLPAAFGDLRDDYAGRLRGVVESAQPLDDSARAALEQALSARTGKEVVLQTRVEPALLGGVRVTLAGTRYDGSALARIEQLRTRLADAEIARS